MSAASGAPAPPRAIRGLAPLPGEPAGLYLTDRLTLCVGRRIEALPERARAEVWSAVSGWGRVTRAQARWDNLSRAEAARRARRRAEAAATERDEVDVVVPEGSGPVRTPEVDQAATAELDGRIRRALGQ